MNQSYILLLEQVGINDIHIVGGKNASLGEMIAHLKNLEIDVPDGFATTSEAYKMQKYAYQKYQFVIPMDEMMHESMSRFAYYLL